MTYGFGSLIASVQGLSLPEGPDGQQGEQESTVCPGSKEGQGHPGPHWAVLPAGQKK